MTERTAQEIKQAVLEHYGARARQQLAKEAEVALTAVPGDSCDDSACCGPAETPAEETSSWADRLYSADELGTVPQEVRELSLGCGNPTAIAELRPGEAVLDLGSGSGLDCFLAAHQVGPEGRAVGLDMSDDMLELARRNLAKVSATNVEFHKGEMESMPLPDDTFDVIISNCVINLSPDKDAVFREGFRVLKPGGRMRVSDIVWTRTPTAAEQNDLASWAGCIAGALEVDEYVGKLQAAGFDEVEAKLADEPGERGWTSAYVTARKMTSDDPRQSQAVLACRLEERPRGAPSIQDVSRAIRQVTRDEGGALVVSFDATVTTELEAFVAAEQQCCAEISWNLEQAGAQTHLKMVGTAEQLDLLEKLFTQVH